jgi:hypothetical protein
MTGPWYLAVAAAAMLVGAVGVGALRRTAPPAITTHGEWVYIRKGADSIRAYVAYPERKDKGAGVIVIHEIFGLTEWEPTVADRLAKGGGRGDRAGFAVVQAREDAVERERRPETGR